MLDDLGFVEIDAVLTADQCADLIIAVESASGGRVGSRNLLDLKSCRELAVALKAHAGVAPLLPPTAVATPGGAAARAGDDDRTAACWVRSASSSNAAAGRTAVRESTGR